MLSQPGSLIFGSDYPGGFYSNNLWLFGNYRGFREKLLGNFSLKPR